MAPRWRRLGRLLAPEGQYPWWSSHASNPTAQILGRGLVRIFFGARDSGNRSQIAAAVFSLEPSPRLQELTPLPLLSPGEPGLFDDSGVSMGCLVQDAGRVLLYYVGWNLGVTVPWRNSIGLAVSTDGGRSFTKHSLAPLLDRSASDPYSLSYPWIVCEAESWQMWYGSNLRWGKSDRDMDHAIKHAVSTDGIAWRRDGHIALAPQLPEEIAVARPCVVGRAGSYEMWFAHRRDRYRIGRARSAEGRRWERAEDELHFDRPPESWEEEMTTYPCVFDCEGRRYLLYNGNHYGRTGFGLAVLE